MRSWSFLPLLVASVTLSSCGKKAPPVPAADAAEAAPKSDVEAVVAAALDRSVDPCTDFYQFACGGWLKTAQIPADQSRWSRSFQEIKKSNDELVREILEKAAENPGDDPDAKRLGDFYAACVDEAGIEARGLQVDALQKLLKAIDAIASAADVMRVAGELQLVAVDALLSGGVENDFKDPKLMRLQLGQGGLSLPDRAYYFPKDDEEGALLADFETHVAHVLQLAGSDETSARADAKAILALETRLAEVSRERAAMRDTEALYHPMDRARLAELTPKLAWNDFLAGTGYPDLQAINVTTPEFLEALPSVTEDLPAVKAYLRWRLLHTQSNSLPKAFRDARFDYFGKRLNGIEEQPPRWKRCVWMTEDALGQSIGKIYVQKRFPGESKSTAVDMIRRVETAFADGLPALTWMDDVTRERALGKMHQITNKIGYPDAWRDFSALEPKRDDPVGNDLSASAFNARYLLDRVGGPPDPNQWYMHPQTVNAYYNPPMNEIVFPAGIMQPPFFSLEYPQAMNYGAMGMVMGHEITHGFDDEGRKFRGDGVMEEWWEPAVAERFEKAAACVEDQYAAYEPLPGTKLNGKLTLGENIADNGGVKQAYRAYRGWVADHGEEPKLAGLTGDQQFFVGTAQSWCTLYRPEALEVLVKTDPHSPAANRVNGPLRNFDAFAEAFSCAPGTPLNPADRCEVW